MTDLSLSISNNSLDADIQKLISINSLLEHADNIGSFSDKYLEIEDSLSTEDKRVLLRSIYSKYSNVTKISQKVVTDTGLFDIFKLIYRDEKKAAYEAKLLILNNEKDVSHEEYRSILVYAQTPDEKLNVLSRMLMIALVSYKEDLIRELIVEINEERAKVAEDDK